MSMGKRLNKKKTSNIVLIIMGSFLFLFVVAMIVMYWFKESVPDTLIECVLDTSRLEAFVLGAIKVSKVIRGENIEGGS